MKSFHIIISGIVQGVFFRKFTKEKAIELGLHGYVHNCHDGSVEIEAEGDEASLEKFIAWCRHGPQHAVVTNIDLHEQSLKSFSSFEIKR